MSSCLDSRNYMVTVAGKTSHKSSARPKSFREFRPKQPDDEFYGKNSIRDFGYEFNKSGELRSILNGGKFIFHAKVEDEKFNKRHYDALGELVTAYVYGLLENAGGLRRIRIPLGCKAEDPAGFFFATSDYETNDRMVILIHGNGVVRAGQWSRKLIINESLTKGTQLPFVEKFKNAGFSVVVLNTNQNRVFDETGKPYSISENGDAVAHAFHVWEKFVVPSNAKRIAIVAHSAGGFVTSLLATQKVDEFSRVFAVALTDTAICTTALDSPGWKRMLKIAKNWVASRQPLDSDEEQVRNQIIRVSSGTANHEETSSKAIDSIFKFITEKLSKAEKTENDENCCQYCSIV